MSVIMTISIPREAITRLRKEYRTSGAVYGLTTAGFDRWMAEVKLKGMGIEVTRWTTLPNEIADETEVAADG